MAVEIEVLLQLDQAEKALDEYQSEFVKQIREAAARGEDAYKLFAQHSEEELRKLALVAKKESERQASEAEKAAERAIKAQKELTKETERAAREQSEAVRNAFEEIGRAAQEKHDADMERRSRAKSAWKKAIDDDIAASKKRLEEEKRDARDSSQAWESRTNDLRGFIGDMGDAVGLLGNQFLGLSKAQQESLENTISLAEKGMALGAAFGPLGAVIGGVTLGIIGYTKALKEKKAAEETKRFADSVSKAAGQLGTYLDTLFENGEQIIKSSQDTQGAIDDLDKTLAESQLVPEDLSKKPVKTLKKELGKVNAAIVDERKKLAASKANLDKILKDQNELGASITDDRGQKDAAYARQRELQAAADEERRILSNAEESAKQSLATQKALDAEIKSRQSKKVSERDKYVAITLEQLNAIVEAERAQEERMAGVGGGPEARLQAQYDAEQAAFDEALKQYQYYATLEYIAAQEASDKKVALAQEEQERISLIRMTQGLTLLEAQKSAEAAVIEQYAATVNAALDSIGQMALSSIGGVATDAFNSWLEAIATGEKDAEKSFEKIRAAFVRNVGQQLVADGTKNVLQGAANLITGQPAGAALIGIGTAEIAAGAAMGAAGARAQRRQGYGDESSGNGSLGRNSSSRDSGPIVQAPTIIQIQSLIPGDKRAWQEAGRAIEQARTEYHKG